MTTKYKIIAGFTIMVLIVGAEVLLGFNGIQKSSDSFTEYRRLSQINARMGDLAKTMNAATTKFFSYMITHDEQEMKEVETYIASATETLRELEKYVQNDDTKALMKDLEASMGTFSAQQEQVHLSLMDNIRQYNEIVRPTSVKMREELMSMTKQTQSVGNIPALVEISNIWSKVSFLLSGVSRFANSRTEDDAAVVKTRIAETDGAMKPLGDSLTTDNGRQTYASLLAAYETFKEAFKSMDKLSATVRQNREAIGAFLDATNKKIHDFSMDVDGRMDKFGSATLESNETAQANMLMTGGAGVALGLVIAVIIVFGIVRVLREMSVFASAVVQGDFAHEVKVKEKGEIGTMLTAMREIPAVLEGIMASAHEMAVNIRGGKLRERFDTSTLSGSFSRLGLAVNGVSDAYTEVIDAIPLPVMTCGTDMQIHFLNPAGQTTMGGNNVRTPCQDQLKANECGSEKCFGKRAMQSNRMASGETTVYPQGKRMEIFVTAMPLHDMNGEVNGYMELITDLS